MLLLRRVKFFVLGKSSADFRRNKRPLSAVKKSKLQNHLKFCHYDDLTNLLMTFISERRSVVPSFVPIRPVLSEKLKYRQSSQYIELRFITVVPNLFFQVN